MTRQIGRSDCVRSESVRTSAIGSNVRTDVRTDGELLTLGGYLTAADVRREDRR